MLSAQNTVILLSKLSVKTHKIYQGIKLEPRVAATLTDLFKKTKTSYVDGLADKLLALEPVRVLARIVLVLAALVI